MTTMAQHFDTLGAAEELEAAGLPAQAAKAISLVVDRSREDDKSAPAIAAMRTDFEKEIAELKTDVAVLKTDVAELKTDVAELKTDVAVLKTDVAVLKSQMRILFWAVGVILAAVLANFAVTVNILLRLN